MKENAYKQVFFVSFRKNYERKFLLPYIFICFSEERYLVKINITGFVIVKVTYK